MLIWKGKLAGKQLCTHNNHSPLIFSLSHICSDSFPARTEVSIRRLLSVSPNIHSLELCACVLAKYPKETYFPNADIFS